MSDDLDLLERFAPLASAPFAPAVDPAVLRMRVARRRRRNRAVLAGGTVAGLVLVGALAVAARGGSPEPTDDVRAVAPVSTTLPESLGTGPRLVIRAVPDAMASHGCAMAGVDAGAEGDWVTCSLEIPGTAVPDGINLAWKRGPASEEILAAWDRGDAESVAQATGGLHGEATFLEIGGHAVLALGETERVDGSSLGHLDRVTTGYEVRIGASIVQVIAEGATDDQLEQVIGGLSLDPTSTGFAIPRDALPSAAEPISQGQQRLWFEPDRLEPSRSVDNGGDAAGITFQLEGERSPLVVTVVRDVDAPSYVDTWADQQQRPGSTEASPVVADRRHGQAVGLRSGGSPAGAIVTRRVAVAADDRTVVLVEGPEPLRSTVLDVAGRTAVGPVPVEAAEIATSTTIQASGLPGGGEAEGESAPGWYAPSDLPDGWTLQRGVAGAADGSGEAQLWLISPSGNQFVVTLKVPSGRPWHSEDAVLHPLPGQSQPVYAKPGRGDLPRQGLVTRRPGAVILVDWLDVDVDDDAERATAELAGPDELDDLAGSLRPVTADEWRIYLQDVPAQPDLLAADALVDLPDEA